MPTGETITCLECGADKAKNTRGNYSPLQLIFGKRFGWYSGKDGEICGECMEGIVKQ